MEALVPAEPARQRNALSKAVARSFPEAKLRSFADGVATFLDSQHLIVASYADLPGPRGRASESGPDDVQESLFAA